MKFTKGCAVKIGAYILLIEDKLLISQKPIRFIKEGNFLRVYNESFYILDTYYSFSLKLIKKYIKKLDQTILMAGIPTKTIISKFPEFEITHYGCELIKDFDLSGYSIWHKNLFDQLSKYTHN